MITKKNAKSFIISLIFIAIGLNTNAQVLISLLLGDKLNSDKLKFGLDGGANFSLIGNIDEAKYKAGFNLGFYFDLLLKKDKNWYVHTGVLVKSPMGAKNINPYSLGDTEMDSLFASGTIERKLSYFNVPILVRYKLPSGLYFEAGPMLGLMNKATDYFYNEVKEKEDLNYKLDVMDQYKRIDAGAMGGIGFHVLKGTGYNLGVRYYYGLTEILKDNPGDIQRNSAFYAYASIPVGAGEKAKAKAAAKAKEKEEKKAAEK